MAKDLSFQVINVRPGNEYSVMGCDLAVGFNNGEEFVGLLTIRGLWLKKTKSGDYMINWPNKPRIRNGEHVKDAKGYNAYDNFVDLYGEKGAKGDDKYAITDAAWKFKDKLIKMMVEAGEVDESDAPQRSTQKPSSNKPSANKPPAGRAASKTAPASRPVQTAVVEEEEDGDDDLPF